MSNPAMARRHVVQQGECFSKIAARYGFGDYKLLYDHPDNAELKKKRKNPNVIFPGDVIMIPDKGEKAVHVATGATHRFKVALPRKMLRLVLLDHEHKPIENVPYTLEVDGEPPTDEKKTGKGGKIEESVPVLAGRATVRVGARVLELSLGGLNPVRDAPDAGISGLQGRLRNLGYHVGPADGKLGPRTKVAVAMFQSAHDLDVSGDPDSATLAKLEQVHGC